MEAASSKHRPEDTLQWHAPCEKQVEGLLATVFTRITQYYKRLEAVQPDEKLMKGALKRAWKVIDADKDMPINKLFYGYAAYSTTLEYPKASAVSNVLGPETLDFGNHSFFELSPRLFGVDQATLRRAMTWQLAMLDKVIGDLRVFPEAKRKGILSMIVIGQFAPMIYLQQALPKSEVKENYLAYQRRVFYFGLSYVVDFVIDDPTVDEKVKKQLDRAIEEVISGSECSFESELPMVQLAINYLKAFSKEITGVKNEEELRVHLLAFHRVQRAAQDCGKQELYSSNMNHMSTAKSYFSFSVVPLLFGRFDERPNPDAYFPFVTFAQLNDDIRDYEKDQGNKQRTALTAYSASPNAEDPLSLWPKVFADLIKGKSKAMQKSMALLAIKIIEGKSLPAIRRQWPNRIDKLADQMMRRVEGKGNASFKNQGVVKNLGHTVDEFLHEYSTHRQEVMGQLERLCTKESSDLYGFMNYSLKGGKCGRSYLIRVVSEHYGKEPETLLNLMMAVEMAQTGSLVLDDLPSQDDASLRRGQQCLHKKEGVGVDGATLTGVSFVTEAFRLLSQLPVDPKTRLTLMEMSAEAMGPKGLCLGQLMDLKETPVEFEDYIKMYALKTSKGFEIPMVGAAIACEAPSNDIGQLEVLAHKMGVAYQVRDDLLEETATDKSAERTADLITEKYPKEARELFFRYRKEVFDTIFEMFKGDVRGKLLRVMLKLLLLDGELDPYEAESKSLQYVSK